MKEIEWSDSELLRVGLDLVEAKSPFVIKEVPARTGQTIKRGLLLLNAYHEKLEAGRNDRILLIRQGLYGFRYPMLWGVLTLARGNGYAISVIESFASFSLLLDV